MVVKKFKVWSRSPRYFDSLTAARAYAEVYFRRTGNIVAITAA